MAHGANGFTVTDTAHPVSTHAFDDHRERAAAIRTRTLPTTGTGEHTLLVQALISAARRGVRVRVLVPGPHTDSFTVKIATKVAWGDLLLAGIEIFVYPPTMLHVTLFVIDREFGAQMTGVYERDLESEEQYDDAAWEQRTLGETLMET